jgi:preprotein translocase subunit YajC
MNSPILLTLSSAAASAGAPPTWLTWLPIAAMFVVFWFLILRPQMRRQKEHQAKIAA